MKRQDESDIQKYNWNSIYDVPVFNFRANHTKRYSGIGIIAAFFAGICVGNDTHGIYNYF